MPHGNTINEVQYLSDNNILVPAGDIMSSRKQRIYPLMFTVLMATWLNRFSKGKEQKENIA